MLIGDTKRQETLALSEAYRHFQKRSVGFIGAASSSPTVAVSKWLSIPSIDRAMISYSATSPELSEPRFSNFLRTPPSDDVPAQLMAQQLMKGPEYVFYYYDIEHRDREWHGYVKA